VKEILANVVKEVRFKDIEEVEVIDEDDQDKMLQFEILSSNGVQYSDLHLNERE